MNTKQNLTSWFIQVRTSWSVFDFCILFTQISALVSHFGLNYGFVWNMNQRNYISDCINFLITIYYDVHYSTEHRAVDMDTMESDSALRTTNGYDSKTGTVNGTHKEKRKGPSLPLGRKIPMARTPSTESPPGLPSEVSTEVTPSPAKAKRNKFVKSASMDAPRGLDGTPNHEIDGRRSPGAEVMRKVKKLKTPDASPPGTLTHDYSGLSPHSDNTSSLGSEGQGRPKLAKISSMGSSFEMFKSVDIMSDISEVDSIDVAMATKFSYAVRVFPGQDPSEIHVGWVTPGYHHHSATFDPEKTRGVKVNLMNDNGGVQERCVVIFVLCLSLVNVNVWFIKSFHLWVFGCDCMWWEIIMSVCHSNGLNLFLDF